MLGVARYMYNKAKEVGCDEVAARQLFVVGLLHDVGYEWGNSANHATVGAEVLSGMQFLHAADISKHGNPDAFPMPFATALLNEADLHTSPTGEPMDIGARLEDIKQRHGEGSPQYINVKVLIERMRREGLLKSEAD